MTDSGDTKTEAPSKSQPAAKARHISGIGRFVSFTVYKLNWLSPVLTAAATLLLVWVAYWQRVDLHNTDTTLRQTLLAHRAYVGPDRKTDDIRCDSCDPTVLPHVPKGIYGTDFFVMGVRNYGQTPAFDLSVYLNWKEMPFGEELPKNFTFPDVGAYISPKASVNPADRVSIAMTFNPEVIALIVKARAHHASVYVYGHIDYRDAFHKDRSTPFCSKYLPDFGSDYSFSACPEHNSPAQDD